MHTPTIHTRKPNIQSGFTLIETLVAITIVTIAVIAPLSLAGQSLVSAQYARDQVIAFNLAQEAIEVVRQRRDNTLLDVAKNGTSVFWLTDIPFQDINGAQQPFRIDTISGEMTVCGSGACPQLLLDADRGFYNYSTGEPSKYTRTVYVKMRNTPGRDEVSVQAVVTWQSGAYGGLRSVTVEDELYAWVPTE